MKIIDNFLNNITMYRLMLYYLLVLLGLATVLAFFSLLPFNFISLIFSVAFLVIVSSITNKIFAYVFKVQTNFESIYISALILSLIITPARDIHSLPFMFWAAVFAAASKFIFTVNRKHIFNPAALAVFAAGLGVSGGASWWIGTTIMAPIVFLGGFLIVKKIKRWDLVLSFFAVSISAILAFSIFKGGDAVTLVREIFLDSPILFFALVMLVEPLTTPSDKIFRMVYGGFIGFLFIPQVHIGSLYITPEIALVLGNVFSYLVSPKEKLILKLQQKNQLTTNLYDFVFELEKKFVFTPGQFMEWTLEHKNPDSRGNRRYFTIASSPSEGNLRIGTRLSESSSSYKRAFLNMKIGSQITTSLLSGEFVLPKDQNIKLVFIAGGIGVTPFRSMVKNMIDKNEKRDIILFYCVKISEDAIYMDIFKQAQNLGLKTIVTVTDGKTRLLTKEMIEQETPDYKERMFYLSGPHGMVVAFEKTLSEMNVEKSQIKTDYFSGYD